MKIRPLHDRIIVHRLDEGEQRVGGIIIPDTAKEKPQQGTVVAVGNGTSKDDGTRVPLDVKAGSPTNSLTRPPVASTLPCPAEQKAWKSSEASTRRGATNSVEPFDSSLKTAGRQVDHPEG